MDLNNYLNKKFNNSYDVIKYNKENILLIKDKEKASFYDITRKDRNNFFLFENIKSISNRLNKKIGYVFFINLKKLFIIDFSENKTYLFDTDFSFSFDKILYMNDEKIVIRDIMKKDYIFLIKERKILKKIQNSEYSFDYKEVFYKDKSIITLNKKSINFFDKEIKLSVFGTRSNDWFFNNVDLIKEDENNLYLNISMFTFKRTNKNILFRYKKDTNKVIIFSEKIFKELNIIGNCYNIENNIYLNSYDGLKPVIYRYDENDNKLINCENDKNDKVGIFLLNLLFGFNSIVSSNLKESLDFKILNENEHIILISELKRDVRNKIINFIKNYIILTNKHTIFIKKIGFKIFIKKKKISELLVNSIKDMYNTLEKSKVLNSFYIDSTDLNLYANENIKTFSSGFIYNNYVFLNFIEVEKDKNFGQVVDKCGIVLNSKMKFLTKYFLSYKDNVNLIDYKKMYIFSKYKRSELKKMSIKNKIENMSRAK